MLHILKGLNDDFHACSSCQQFLLLTHGEFLKLASAVTWQSNGSDFFTGHNGRLATQPPKRPLPSVRIEIRVTQLLYSALESVGKINSEEWAWKNSLCCTAGHTFLSSWRFGFSAFLKVSTTNLGSCSSIWAWSHPTDPTKYQSCNLPETRLNSLDSWRIFHRKFSHLVLLSRLQVWGLNFHHRKSVHGNTGETGLRAAHDT